jgi:nucleotide-binding universal stress UspA family protein
MKLIVATDFSETAARASAAAAGIARRAGDSVVLLHVSEPPTRNLQELTADVRAWEQALREKDREDLQLQAGELRARGVAVDERREAGHPPEVIAALAKETDARLIVLGSHGRRLVTRLLLGSVAQETLLRSDRPVLVVRPGAVSDGLARWADADRPLRVTLAIDCSPASTAAAAWTAWLRSIGPVELRLVHAYEPLGEALRLGLRVSDDRRELEAALERELRSFLGELAGAGTLSLVLRGSGARPGEVVAEEARAAGADLLVLGTHQRTRVQRIWLGSTAELALRHAELPVVCVPAILPRG